MAGFKHRIFTACVRGNLVPELCLPMQDRNLARRRLMRRPLARRPHARRLDGVALGCARFIGGLFAAAALAACSSIGGDPLTVFADPGRYQYNTCEQIAGQRKAWVAREQELKQLMDKAEQST